MWISVSKNYEASNMEFVEILKELPYMKELLDAG